MQRPGDGGVPGGTGDSVTVMPEMAVGEGEGEGNEGAEQKEEESWVGTDGAAGGGV